MHSLVRTSRPKRRCPGHRRFAGALIVLTAVAAGCQAPFGRGFGWEVRDLWHRNPVKLDKVVPPTERIAELREVAERAPKMSELEQIQQSAAIAQAIQDEDDPLIRAQILRTLAAFPTPAADAVLRAATGDSEVEVRLACVEAWGTRRGKPAIDMLGEILKNEANQDVRLAAARALGNMGDQAVVPVLGAVLEDKDPAMQYRAVQSLRSVTGRDFGDDVNAWREFVNGGNPPEESYAAKLLRWW